MAHQFAAVNGATLHYDVQGNGDAIVLIHSGLGHLDMWDPQMTAFSARHRVVRYDVRGWGRSEGPPIDYADRDDLAALLRHLRILRTAAVGSSSGGGIAIDFALAFPETVTALVLAAPAVGGHQMEPDQFMASKRRASHEAYERGDKHLAAEITAQVWVDGPNRTPADVNPLVRKRALEMILHT